MPTQAESNTKACIEIVFPILQSTHLHSRLVAAGEVHSTCTSSLSNTLKGCKVGSPLVHDAGTASEALLQVGVQRLQRVV